MAKDNIASTVWGLIGPIAEEQGVFVWDVRYEKEGPDWFLRVFIDKDGGIDIDDCERFSRAADAVIDEADPIADGYFFEVSSPGIDRRLTRPEHFKSYIDTEVTVKLIRARDGLKEFSGRLSAYDGKSVTVVLPEGDMTAQLDEISSVRVKSDI